MYYICSGQRHWEEFLPDNLLLLHVALGYLPTVGSDELEEEEERSPVFLLNVITIWGLLPGLFHTIGHAAVIYGLRFFKLECCEDAVKLQRKEVIQIHERWERRWNPVRQVGRLNRELKRTRIIIFGEQKCQRKGMFVFARSGPMVKTDNLKI